MIKIAFVIDTIDSPTGGTEKQLLLLIKHLDKTRFAPCLCVLYVSPWLRENFTLCPLIEIGVTSFKNPGAYRNIWKFSRFLKKEDIDIVQTHFVEGNKVGIVAAKLAGITTIISSRRNQGYWHKSIELRLLGLLNRCVTRYIANSANTREWASATENIPLQQIDVIHNGIDLDLFAAATIGAKHEFRAMLNIPADGVLMGIVANLRPVKGIDVFVKAAEMVSQLIPNAYFIIVGEGEGAEEQRLKGMVADLKLSEKIHFLGKREDIPRILGCLDLGALTSHSESFSNSVVEYLAAGLPVVCTDVGGCREAVSDGFNGYVVPRGDHAMLARRIVEMIQGGRLGEMGIASKAKALESFSLAAMVTAHENLYQQVANGSNS